MSMSHESTSLKKSSSNCLKHGKAVIQHFSEIMIFLNYCIFSGSAEALVRCGGNYSIYWWLSISVTYVPNIMKIRQRFLE